ncbi:phycobiliprotein lyase [Leptolyngbya sp. 7M]|uniref:phycobiliprotein lyase n=1 Tax=Leptolyngbya sp. 7M TaxID=2812896 RepID=UPI001B8CBBF2|nr:phycobiliprotein lyase [Leptolyngbya sp. 7M]
MNTNSGATANSNGSVFAGYIFSLNRSLSTSATGTNMPNGPIKLQGIDPALAKGGASFLWQAHEATATVNPEQAAVLVDVPDDATGRAGKLLRNQGYVEKIPVVSRYWFGPDGILTIETEYEQHQGQERCWFMTDDFRVRVSTVRMLNGIYLMTYCSEQRYVSDADLAAMIEHNRARAANWINDRQES